MKLSKVFVGWGFFFFVAFDSKVGPALAAQPSTSGVELGWDTFKFGLSQNLNPKKTCFETSCFPFRSAMFVQFQVVSGPPRP